MSMLVRNMTRDDIPAGLSLCRYTGWNQTFRDWEMFLESSPGGCRIAETGKVVGTVATFRYQDRFSWIGMVLVHPEFRKQGIGSRLMEEAMSILKNEETVRLDATPAGRDVYRKLHFSDEYELRRMVLLRNPGNPDTPEAFSVKHSDLADIKKMDTPVFGANRLELLAWLVQGCPDLAFLSRKGKDIDGFCMGRHGYHSTQIGPIIASGLAIAENLLGAALGNCRGRQVVVDIPLFHQEWKEWLESLGFTEQRPFIRMYHGLNRFPGLPGKQWAILGPEFG